MRTSIRQHSRLSASDHEVPEADASLPIAPAILLKAEIGRPGQRFYSVPIGAQLSASTSYPTAIQTGSPIACRYVPHYAFNALGPAKGLCLISLR